MTVYSPSVYKQILRTLRTSHRQIYSISKRQTFSKTPRTLSTALNITHQDGSLPATGPPKIIDFNDTAQAFQSKSTLELIKTLFIFSLCSIKPLVDNAPALIKFGRTVFGDKFVSFLMYHTFYQHFCAGEDGEAIKPRIKHLSQFGVGSILDYAAEADLESPLEATVDTKAVDSTGKSGKYDEHTELLCDKHCDIFESCITSVHNATSEGFAAIKFTALANPILLERVSIVIQAVRDLYAKFDTTDTQSVNYEQFKAKCYEYFNFTNDKDIEVLFKKMDIDNNNIINLFKWNNTLTLQDVLDLVDNAKPGTYLAEIKLTNEEKMLIERFRHRAERLARLGEQLKVHVMVDAEHTYFQAAIDYFILELQQKYNHTFSAVWNTYQCYLKDSYKRLLNDLQRAKNEKFIWSGKLVRGAYMNSENERAKQLGVPSPVWDNIGQTHSNYNRCLEYALSKLHRAKVLVASHNQASIELTTQRMKEMNIAPSNNNVYFAQLLGMADHLTFGLGQNGYQAFKYVPYGKVMEVMPYLIRRAQENSNMLGGVGVEVRMVKQELYRRFFG